MPGRDLYLIPFSLALRRDTMPQAPGCTRYIHTGRWGWAGQGENGEGLLRGFLWEEMK